MARLGKQGRWTPVEIPEISEVSGALKVFVSSIDAIADSYWLKYYNFYYHYVDIFEYMAHEVIEGIMGSYGLDPGDICYDTFSGDCLVVIETERGNEFSVPYPTRVYIREDLADEIKG